MKHKAIVRNPLKRDGTSQRQRFPAALSPDHAKIDEKELQDFLIYVNSFSEKVDFYENNSQSGNWQHFFENDISIILAKIANADLSEYRAAFNVYIEELNSYATDLEQAITPAANLIDTAFFNAARFVVDAGITGQPGNPLLELLDGYLSQLTGETGLRAELTGMIKSGLSLRFRDLVWVYHELEQERGAGFGAGVTSVGIKDEYEAVDNLIWFEGNAADISPFITEYNTLTGGNTLLFYKGQNEAQQIRSAVFSLKTLFENFLNSALRVVELAAGYVLESINSRDDHQAHHALFLTFLRIFKFAQDHLNELTGRHLDFYYEEVLRLLQRNEINDQAHVVFKLREGAPDVKIEEGSRLFAGKDPSGKPMFYQTRDEIVVNQGQVEQLKSLFISPERDAPNQPLQKGREYYAASVANSADGKGKELEGEVKKWNPFGEDQKSLIPADRTMSEAEMGFSISSPNLLLREGLRTIRLVYAIDKNSRVDSLNPKELAHLEAGLLNSLKASYTAEEKWVDVTPEKVAIITSPLLLADIDQKGIDIASNQILSGGSYAYREIADDLDDVNLLQESVLMIELKLEEDLPGFVSYHEKDHGEGYDSPYPVLKFSFDNLGLRPRNSTESLLTPTSSPGWKLFQGKFFLENGPDHSVLHTTEDYYLDQHSAYDPEEVINNTGSHRLFEGKLYKSVRPSMSPVPEKGSPFWSYLSISSLTSSFPAYSPNTAYNVGVTVEHEGSLYQAVKASFSPQPADNPLFWEEEDLTANPFTYLSELRVRQVKIRVDVEEMKNLNLENENGPVSQENPFEPFGFQPERGSSFYIGSGEIFGKKVTDLKVNIEWKEVPTADFSNYLGAYPNPPAANTDYTARTYLLNRRKWVEVRPQGSVQPLFDAADARNPIELKLDLKDVVQAHDLDFNLYTRDPDWNENQVFSNSLNRGFIRLDLDGPEIMFGQQDFSREYTRKISEYGHAIKNSTDPQNPPAFKLPVSPWVPKIAGIKVAYGAEEVVKLNRRSESAYENRVERVYHRHPFGLTEIHASFLEEEKLIPLIPSYEKEGNLFIGIRKLEVPSQISLLFQIAEGSANPDLDRGELSWKYLANNVWKSLPPVNIVMDSTDGFRSSGIITISMPADARSDSKVMPENLHWLMVSLSENVKAIDQMIDIQAQAVTVALQNNDNDLAHLETALPEETIVALERTLSGVGEVVQPFASFGGRPAENEKEFRTRVSERLRHKDRSITVWDYERMVLQDFPEIYKVKCLNHTDASCEIQPGHVTVVTVPNLRNKNAVNIFEPKASITLMNNISDMLHEHISPWVNLKVTNPLYERIRVSCGIGFRSGFDPNFYSRELANAIQRFLSPWAFEEGQDIVFGGRIHRSWILNFIEEQPYVDYVIGLKMDHIVDEDTIWENVREAVATTSRTILVSDMEHSVLPMGPGDYYCEGSPYYQGIGFWVVGNNLIVQ